MDFGVIGEASVHVVGDVATPHKYEGGFVSMEILAKKIVWVKLTKRKVALLVEIVDYE